MKHGRWYFDFISPFAYLQWQRMAQLREFAAIEPVPILFAGVLNHFGQKGPAEIPGKREFTYQFVYWKAKREGIALRFPPAHPFNPLHALRLSIAAGNSDAAIDAIFYQVWREGRAIDSVDALHSVASRLDIADLAAALSGAEVKTQLRSNTEAAIAANVFGVPTLDFGERRFWGDDATDMALTWLRDPVAFDADPEFARLTQLPQAAQRG